MLLYSHFYTCLSCPFPSVCVYVNKHGNCGPHLDRKQVQRLPDHFGPEAVNLVLQQTVQACLDCAYQPKVLLGCLQSQGGGGEVVRGTDECLTIKLIQCDFKTLTIMKYCFVSLVRTDGGKRLVKLPSASSAGFVLRFLERVCRHLQCDNLFSSQPFSPHNTYDRAKSGIFTASDWPQECLVFWYCEMSLYFVYVKGIIN